MMGKSLCITVLVQSYGKKNLWAWYSPLLVDWSNKYAILYYIMMLRMYCMEVLR